MSGRRSPGVQPSFTPAGVDGIRAFLTLLGGLAPSRSEFDYLYMEPRMANGLATEYRPRPNKQTEDVVFHVLGN